MALVKFGGGIAQISGSIAGTTFARNRYGAIARNRSLPVDPASPRQINARSIVISVVATWTATLTAAQRTAWATYAQALNLTNRIGESMKITGFNAYVMCNAARTNAGIAMLEDAPTVLEMPGADPTFVPTYDESSANLSVVFDNTLTWATAVGGHLLVYMGEPQNKTRNFFKGNYRYVGKIDGAVVAPTSPQTFANLPFVPVEGQRIWTKYRIVNPDGSMSGLIAVEPTDVVA